MGSRELLTILQFAVRKGISDVHLKVDKPPVFRKDGQLVTQKGAPAVPAELMQRFVDEIVPLHQVHILKQAMELDTSFSLEDGQRFRVSIFRQREQFGIVFRVIETAIRTIDDLHLPPVLRQIADERRGLVLVTGATGSGKSTTMAAMVDHINTTRSDHIVTIEDPIEYLFIDKRSVVNQREVGLDTRTFASALRAALRQDPDVILVGEMRDLETIETALHASETGHLVISTLHTIDAAETINRVVSVFPPHHQRQIRLILASILRGIVSQRLVVRKDGTGRVPAVEVLVGTEFVKELVADELRLSELRDVMAKGKTSYGMQTFDQSLMDLYKTGYISYEEALKQSSNPSDFALKVSGISSTSDSSWE
ncbi:MAG: type IV pilus twitching motility protein PilT [Myxococcales bacterium]|nr:type IV pilus twitching motility protein PilT [Myxococcales bacterium]